MTGQATDARDTIDTAAPGTGLGGFVDRRIRAALLDTRVAAPGTVIAYTPATGTAQVAVGYLRIRTTEVAGQEVEVPEPPEIVPRARVAILQGSTHSDHPPILPGDTGLLIFLDRALGLWAQSPAVPAIPIDPVHSRAHNAADAVFLPMLAPDATKAAAPANPAARVIDAPLIQLGSVAPASEFLLQGTTLASAAAGLHATLFAVPQPAVTPVETTALANANAVAILALLTAIIAAPCTKVMGE